MKIVKICALVLVAVLAIVSPFIGVIAAATLTPPQYSNTFVGALNEKYDRLNAIDGEKLVVVGGSSVAFGVDSEMIEKYTGMPVVNFGLYAALGTKLMLDLSRSAIGSGDVVVIAPELDPQTMSLYFSSEQTLMALDDDFSMFWDLTADDKLSVLGGMWSFAADKLANMIDHHVIDPEGVYNSRNFDERGDLTYPREHNVMSDYYDPNTRIDLTEDLLDPEFIDYLNDYIAYCERRGATVLFAYCPMNERAVVKPYADDEQNKAARREFCERLESLLDCEVIGDIENSIREAEYFYDTNFHLNDAGRAVHTVQLTRDLLFALDIPKSVAETLPEKPALPDLDISFSGTDANEKYFEFALRENGTYTIVGLSDAGKAEKTLTVPLGYNGRRVTAIAQSALSGGAVEKLIITEDTNLRMLENGAFKDATELRELRIYFREAEELMPPADFFGTRDDFRIYVPRDTDYNVDYNWVEVLGIGELLKFMED